MKSQLSVILLLGMLGTWPMTLVRAEEPRTSGMEAQGHQGGEEHFREKLGLTEDQAAKLKTLRDSEKADMKPLWEKQRALLKKLDWQIADKAHDSEIQITLQDLKANRKAIQDQMDTMQNQKEAILTPTQQAKMLLLRMKRFHHGRHENGEEGQGHDSIDTERK